MSRAFPFEPAFVSEAMLRDAGEPASALAAEGVALEHDAPNPGEGLRRLVRFFGEKGLLRLVTDARFGGAHERMSSIGLCLVRERLGHASPLVELAFAMQGLGSYPMTLAASEHGSTDAAEVWLPKVVRGEAVAAFALTEAQAGTDLGGLATTAVRRGDTYVLHGEKRFISNAGVADVYVVFARTEDGKVSAFAVDAHSEGLSVRPQAVLGGHPIGEVVLEGVVVPEAMRLGAEGRGMALALGTLHRFRPTVGAAALGFAQRALDESVAHVSSRQQFGAPLSELPLVQAKLGEMACELEAARLLVYRAAAAIDAGDDRGEVARKGSMAKLVATEGAQRVIDAAVQLHGGAGVLTTGVVARLYEEVRALRIYEGTNDVQKLLIARELLR
ncbi:MAG: acyl-CoA dehydrogenase family protein [Sandaracinus sp.]|nr:acyl-CoA dehydrogenase family protein [Sandaracinus sp.]MCB9632618.1 acyl-CoA dehydrogenase family protein [Sandaracinus sp.]